ncbi:PH domain-containing protein [Cytobacillus oceanisediminis]|nr:PH domain-containing protein [Cytobacillus oceanisediminis]UOE57707.1 PH domain-containing protein [Cytobacillus oceanisediminis]
MMSNPKRLHPISAVANFLKHLKEMLVPFLVFVVFGSRGGNGEIVQLVLSLGVIIAVFMIGILTWWRYTYRLEEGELRIEYGVLIRKKRYIPLERIQSLDLSEGLLQRPFGLVKMKVETAGSSGAGEAEAVLTAISKKDAAFIQQAFSAAKKNPSEMETVLQNREVIYKISPGELLLLASTSGGAGVVISAVFAFVFQFEEIIPYEKVFTGLEGFIANGIIFVSILVFIVFFIAWLIALIGSMLKYADFTLIKTDKELIVTRGLLEKRQMTIPLNRIQAIQFRENLLRQPLGLATVYIESAGGSIEDNESARLMILPIVKKTRIAGLLKPHLFHYELQPGFFKAPKRALNRYLWRGLLWVLPFVAVPLLFFRPWGYFSLVLLILSLGWSYLKYRDAGWDISSQQLALRYRGIVRITVFMKRNRIQSLTMSESYFQKRRSLATIEAVAMSGIGGTGGTVPDLDRKEVYAIYKWYSYTGLNRSYLKKEKRP